MKNRYLIPIFCMVMTSSLMAQPTIPASVFFDVGDSVRVHQTTSFNFMPGPAGANQNWDFSGLSPETNWLWQAGTPDTTPYFSSFPTADQVFNTYYDGDSIGNYVYYQRHAQSFDLLGSAGSLNGDTVRITYNLDPKKMGPFPLSYNWVSYDQYKGNYPINFSGNNAQVVTTGEVWDTADGYGSITTPLGTFVNVLRVKTNELVIDTVSSMGFTSVTTQQTERYHWCAPTKE